MSAFLAVNLGFFAGLLAIVVSHLRVPSRRAATPRNLPEEDCTFLLDNGRMLHATDAGLELLPDNVEASDWNTLVSLLSPLFPDFPQTQPTQDVTLYSPVGPMVTAQISASRNACRVRIITPDDVPLAAILSGHTQQERDLRDAVIENSPDPHWVTDKTSKILWCNEAYNAFAKTLGKDADSDIIFDISLLSGCSGRTERVSVAGSRKHHWFEVRSRPTHDGAYVHYATSIDAVIEAEIAQRNFVQTLSKTFAHLPIGLAVFDRNKQLALFNPALVDLTSLQVPFLSGRPDLRSFFDHLRENKIVPEPKNYADWREGVNALVDAACDDCYQETWSLPSGLTYRITGRPHPDGAVAFLIEDISAEISLTRRFRSELELSQSVLDAVHEPIAVFSPQGKLTFCNEAFRQFWDTDPDSAFAETTISDAINIWRQSSTGVANSDWADIRDFVLSQSERAEWTVEMTHKSGQPLICNLRPIAAGSSVLQFLRQPDTTLQETSLALSES